MSDMSVKEDRFICPHCGSLLRIGGTLEEIEINGVPDVDVDMILALFHKSVRKTLDVVIDGNFARITMTGKFSSARFKKVATEVRGYGGRWVKGHFDMPIAMIFEKGDENEA